jgi:Ca-activated chloride channel homolog
MKITYRMLLTFAGLALFLSVPGRAQIAHPAPHALASHIVIPQTRVLSATQSRPSQTVQIVEVNAAVDIVQQVATTTLEIVLTNAGSSRLQAEMVVPVPDGAVLRGFTFQGAGAEPSAQLLPKEEARKLYDAIVAKTLDPALLEFIGYNLVRSSVFPVEPRAGQKIRLTYEHLLTADGDRIDYVLPRSESIDYNVPWKVALRIQSKTPIATIYSPSHKLETTRRDPNSVTARIAAEATAEPGSFRLSYLLQKDAITASLLAYPDPNLGGGYFLLLAGAPVKPPNAKESTLKREVTLVIDRSGSMQGEKLEQVREAALQVLEGLEDGEAFNIIVYNEAIESFAPAPVLKNQETLKAARAYIKNLRVRGGTNIHDALVEALRQKPVEGFLPIVLFLTDGLPTVGQTSELAIRNVALKANPHDRRIFTFGVGVDVNTPLLDRIAAETRATASFVLPREDVEVKVAQVFKRLAGPVLASPKLSILSADGKPALGRVRDLTPSKLPDLFEGDQLVLLGQYTGEEPLTFVLDGNYFGEERAFKFQFGFEKATTKNAFVPRLWASRKIAILTDAIRDLGADAGLGLAAATPASHPKMKELIDEIVRLSKEFGILTEYTAFFAEEGTDLSKPVFLTDEATKQFTEKAVQIRTGYASVNQDFNNSLQRSQMCLNARNSFLDDKMNRVSISTVQQINDRAFYKRGDRWVDSQLVEQAGEAPKRVVTIGSEEFRQLAQRLAAQDRQGCITLQGEILLQIDSETVLIK